MRSYLRDADLSGATLSGAWLRFARLDGARCQDTNFAGADLLFASMVKTDLRGANMTAVHVFGVPAWSIETDERTRQRASRRDERPATDDHLLQRPAPIRSPKPCRVRAPR